MLKKDLLLGSSLIVLFMEPHCILRTTELKNKIVFFLSFVLYLGNDKYLN